MSERPSKRARKELTLADKVKLIRDSQAVPKPTQNELSLKYEIWRQTVSDILKKQTFLSKSLQIMRPGTKSVSTTHARSTNLTH